MRAKGIAATLGGKKKTSGGWMMPCLAHDDQTPSESDRSTENSASFKQLETKQ
jgi:hypothetical protein